jgi:hypothetical protein
VYINWNCSVCVTGTVCVMATACLYIDRNSVCVCDGNDVKWPNSVCVMGAASHHIHYSHHTIIIKHTLIKLVSSTLN